LKQPDGYNLAIYLTFGSKLPMSMRMVKVSGIGFSTLW